jgi:hypothetical protein
MSSRFVAGKVLGAPDQDGRFGAQLQHFLCTTADGNGCFSTKPNDAVKLESCCRVIVFATKAKEDQPSIPLPWPFSFSISFL